MEKHALRTQLLAQRIAIENSDWQLRSQQISKHLTDFCLKINHLTKIFAFSSIKKEPLLQDFIDELSHLYTIALPCVLSKQDIGFRVWNKDTQWVYNSLKIKEPSLDSKSIDADPHTVVIVPCLAVDKKGYRLGYGAGYYDRFLAQHPEVISIAINFSEYIVEQVPTNSWDVKVKWIGSEKGIFKTES